MLTIYSCFSEITLSTQNFFSHNKVEILLLQENQVTIGTLLILNLYTVTKFTILKKRKDGKEGE